MPELNRSLHPASPDGRQTCYFCHRRVADVADTYVVDNDTMRNMCLDHKDYVGSHGALADPKLKSSIRRSPQLTAQYIRTSGQAKKRKAGGQQIEAPKVAVSTKGELGLGEVSPEVAAMLAQLRAGK